MKLYAHYSSDRFDAREGRMVFRDDSRGNRSNMNHSGEPIDNIVPFPVSETPDRAQIETQETASSDRSKISSIQTKQAVGEMVADEREVFNPNKSLAPPSSLGSILETEWWVIKKIIPWNAFRFWLTTKRSFWHYTEKVLPQMLDMLEQSPKKYARIDSALLNQTALPTLRALKNSSKDASGVSLGAIDLYETISGGVIDGFEQEQRQFKDEVSVQFKTEEFLKRFGRFLLGNQKGQVEWLQKQQVKQIAQAKKDTVSDISALRKAREDHLQPIQARIKAYPIKANIALRSSAENWMESFASEILENPEAFLNNPQNTYQNIDWKEFCKSPIDLLEALQLEYGDKVIQRSSQAPKMERDANSTLQNIDDRVEEAQMNLGNLQFEGVQTSLARLGIEPAPKAVSEDGTPRDLTTREVVYAIHRALRQAHQNIDLETDVYRQDPIRLTPEEKIAILTRYLHENPEVLKSLEDVSSVKGQSPDRSAKRLLALYILEQDEKTQRPYPVGSLNEEATNSNRLFVAEAAQGIITDAQSIFTTTLPGIQAALRNRNGSDFETQRQALQDFISNFDNLFESIGYDLEGTLSTQSPDSLFSKLPEQERFILGNVIKLKSFRDELVSNSFTVPNPQEGESPNISGLVNFLDFIRNRFNNDVLENLPPNPETYRQDREAAMNSINNINENVRRHIEDNNLGGEAAVTYARDTLGAATIGDGGLNFRSDIQTAADTAEDVFTTLRNRIEVWDRAIAAEQSFSAPLPANPGEFFDKLFERTNAPLEQIISTLSAQNEGNQNENNQPQNTETQIPSLNERMRKMLSGGMTEKAESEFAKQYKISANEQWKFLKGMNLGHVISELQLGDLTHLDGIFDLTNGVVSRSAFKNLVLYRKEGDRLLFHTKDENTNSPGYVVAITPPRDLSENFNPEQMEDPNFKGHANCLIYKKENLQRGIDGLFEVSHSNYSKAGIVLNTGAAQTYNYERPTTSVDRAKPSFLNKATGGIFGGYNQQAA